jgi:hypothetical protein
VSMSTGSSKAGPRLLRTRFNRPRAYGGYRPS